ncbi:MAG: NUDIX domain-containing protein [Phycisphaerae bacterium]|nr:NUDIX domain-containing protein [Phycisphaerae bacterium]
MGSEVELIAWCKQALSRYVTVHRNDADRLTPLIQLLENPPGPLCDRRTVPGHLTASAIVYDPTDRHILLVHHRSLDRWLQPGGHLDAGELPPQAARREVLEETGVNLGEAQETAEPIDIDCHAIPASQKKNEPAHTHHDFRFAFKVRRMDHELVLQESEALDVMWMSIDDPRFPGDLRRCAERVFPVR